MNLYTLFPGVLSSKGDFEDSICSDVLDNPHYSKMVDNYLDAWYKFIPHQSKMDANNCWYVENLNTLPANLTLGRFTSSLTNSTEDRDVFLKMLSKGLFSTQPTQTYFCIPTISMIGFPKTGSTLFYEYARSHPLFAQPHYKEVQFWRNLVRISDPKLREVAVLFYLYHFFDASHQIKDNPSMFTIDASVATIYSQQWPLNTAEKDICIVPLILHETLPKMKFLVQTRNPIDRSWSDFLYFCNPKRWQHTFKGTKMTPHVAGSLFHNYTVKALQEFRDCIESGHSQFRCTALQSQHFLGPCYQVRLGLNMYYIHLVRWFRIFPQERLHVVRLEDLTTDPAGTMDQVWGFLEKPLNLEIQVQAIKKKVKANKWSMKKDGQQFRMFPETRKLLAEFFHPYNVRLAKFLGDEKFLWTET